jgi:2',3'-cyclic-nucleotide 2'-phosphodiesterase (5'-nucleotidase family)
MKRLSATTTTRIVHHDGGMDQNSRNDDDYLSKIPLKRSNSPARKNVLAAMLAFGCLVLSHFWWISPAMEVIGARLTSPDLNAQIDNSNVVVPKHVYVGTGKWQNRGLNLVTCLRSMLGDDSAYGESVDFTVRKLQFLHLKNTKNNTSQHDYLKELQAALYPSLTLGARDADGYLEFVSQTLPKIDAWAEVQGLLEYFKTSHQNDSRKELVRLAEGVQKGNAAAASHLAHELMKQSTTNKDQTNGLLTQTSSQQATVLDGPSVAVLTGDMAGNDYAPPGSVVGFELRKPGTGKENTTSTVATVELAFYKHVFQKSGGIAVIVLRPDPDSMVRCIVARQEGGGGNIRGVDDVASFHDCESLGGTKEQDSKGIPVIGLLFGPDFVGGCKAASRTLDAFGPPPVVPQDNVLWSQEMQNVLSSVSASMRKQLHVASFDLSSGQEETVKVRCDSVASFWDNGGAGGGDNDLSLWQSYRDAAASGVGLDWQLSQCLVGLPLREFPEAKVVDRTMPPSPPLLTEMKVQAQDTCYGRTGSTCTVRIDETPTVCKLTCEHTGSYVVSRGVGGSGDPACFVLERKLETALVRQNETVGLSQEEADPVRWLKDGEEEPHSITLVFTSDVHGRFFRECGPSYCYPGAPHIASVIQTVRTATEARSGTAILVDAGDATFGSQYNETIVGMTMNRLGYEAMALGNHEMDIGLRIDHFADLVDFPLISSNIDGIPFVTDFVRVSLKGGATLCLLGVSANEYNPLAGRNVSFSGRSSVVETTQKLRSRHGCNHTALLSHAGIEEDKKFAMDANVDAIVGGHSHVLMGVQATDHVPESSEFGAVTDMSFPFHPHGHAPVAHTGANGRYMGILRLSWIGARLALSEGNLIPLDATHGVFPDPAVDEWQSRLVQTNAHQEQVEAMTKVKIDNSLARNEVCGQTCRNQECLLGNLATDAMISCVLHGTCSRYADTSKTVATMALLESGTLRACVAPDMEDFAEVLPWPNNLVLLTMTGLAVRRMLEHGVKDMREGQGGAFLQVSGLKYSFRNKEVEAVFLSESNVRQPNHERRRLVTFSAGNPYETEICALPETDLHGASLVDEALYLVVVTDWLASGGDGYGDIISSADAVTTNTTLRESILEHAKSFPIVSAEARSESSDAKLTASAKQGLSGFVGGAISFLSTYPLYTLFVQRSASRKISLSFHDLFSGALLGMLATALSQSIYFVVYSSPTLAEFSPFIRSTVAAITNSLLTTPLWVIITHLQVEESSMSAVAVVCHIYETSGVSGFFTGSQ